MSTSAPPPTVSDDFGESLELPGRRLPPAVAHFLHTEVASGLVLLAAAVIALVWANSPWRGGYEALWSTELTLRLGGAVLTEDLRHWVNDALMALFFFVVGLEIKRELVVGDLKDPRTAALPAFAALGGMAVPAAVYLVVTGGGPGSHGWGMPMATDIAFALGLVALLGRRVPSSLKLFLLTLAIVDDIGAIVVIAVFYSSGVEGPALAAALALLGTIVVLRRAGVTWAPIYVVLSIGVWLATFESGVHATIAGVALGLLTSASPRFEEVAPAQWVQDVDEVGPAGARRVAGLARASVSDAERLQHALHPWTSFGVVPLFALANAGVLLRGDAFEPAGAGTVALAVGLGLVVGKLVGVTGFTWLAVRLGLGSLPPGVRWPQVVGIAGIAGVGFTVSLFIAGLAFDPATGLEPAAKVGILGASAVAAVVGAGILAAAHRRTPPEPAPA